MVEPGPLSILLIFLVSTFLFATFSDPPSFFSRYHHHLFHMSRNRYQSCLLEESALLHSHGR